MRKPILGETLFSLNVGNAARNRESVLTPVVVKKVGRKYFYAGESGSRLDGVKYNLHDWREVSDYMARSCLYESEQERKDEVECSEICAIIWAAFEYRRNHKGVSLPDLRKIRAILDASS